LTFDVLVVTEDVDENTSKKNRDPYVRLRFFSLSHTPHITLITNVELSLTARHLGFLFLLFHLLSSPQICLPEENI